MRSVQAYARSQFAGTYYHDQLPYPSLRACKLVYDALSYAAKQSIIFNLIIVFSAPNDEVNRYLGWKIWIASRHRIVHFKQDFRLAKTGGAVDHESSFRQDGEHDRTRNE